jgi:hypothetical protein
MKNLVLNLFLSSLIICAHSVIIFGCSSTKPNTPYKGSYPKTFNELAYRNQILAEEIGKLPEIQNGISENDIVVLEKIVSLYNTDPMSFEKAFEEMYKTGLPEVRKYCSPLQALFWIIEDGNIDVAGDIIGNYSLDVLLTSAWDFQFKSIPFSDEQISVIIENINDKRLRELYLQKNNDQEYLRRRITRGYKYRSEIFNRKAKKIIRNVKSENEDKRWKNVDAVIERLNAPELFDFYINKNIAYAHYVPSYHRPPRSVIGDKYGDCDDVAYFGKKVLTKAGYDVFGRSFDLHTWPNHVGLGVKLKDGTYLLAVHFNQTGNHMSGPYKTLLELDRALGYGSNYNTRDSFYFDW